MTPEERATAHDDGSCDLCLRPHPTPDDSLTPGPRCVDRASRNCLSAALSVSEQQTAALRQDNERRENLLQRATLFLDYMTDHGGGDPNHIDGNGQDTPLREGEHCPSCDARDLAALIRAAL